jgi:hypothetical protein
MGIEPTKSSYSASPVLKTGRATRRLYASTRHGTGATAGRHGTVGAGRHGTVGAGRHGRWSRQPRNTLEA